MPPATIAASTNSRETSPGATRGALYGARYTDGGGAAGMANKTAADPIAAATAARSKGNPDGGMPVPHIWATHPPMGGPSRQPAPSAMASQCRNSVVEGQRV